jgi:hypothetical protein
MHFQLSGSLRVVPVDLDGEQAITDPATGVVVRFREATEADGPGAGTIVVASFSRNANDRITEEFQRLEQRVVSPEARLGAARHTLATIEGGRYLTLPNLTQLPKRLADFIWQVSAILRTSLHRVTRMATWRSGIWDAQHDFNRRVVQWSWDGLQWHPLPLAMQAEIYAYGYCGLSTTRVAGLQALIAGGNGEPPHHELFSEAWSLQDEAPRSSLTIGVAALETAAKWAVMRLVPGSEWVVTNLPSPPVERVLRDFLPTASVPTWPDGLRRQVPEALMKIVQKGVKLRNEIVHQAAAAPSADSLEAILLGLREVILICDLYGGHTWSEEHLAENTLAEMRNPIA